MWAEAKFLYSYTWARSVAVPSYIHTNTRTHARTMPRQQLPRRSCVQTIVRSAMMFLPPEEFDDASSSNLSSSLPPAKIVKMINRKPIGASEEEIKVNARSRSAKLRVVEKL